MSLCILVKTQLLNLQMQRLQHKKGIVQQVRQTVQFAIDLLQQEVIALLSAFNRGRKTMYFPSLKSLHNRGRLEKIHGM